MTDRTLLGTVRRTRRPRSATDPSPPTWPAPWPPPTSDPNATTVFRRFYTDPDDRTAGRHRSHSPTLPHRHARVPARPGPGLPHPLLPRPRPPPRPPTRPRRRRTHHPGQRATDLRTRATTPNKHPAGPSPPDPTAPSKPPPPPATPTTSPPPTPPGVDTPHPTPPHRHPTRTPTPRPHPRIPGRLTARVRLTCGSADAVRMGTRRSDRDPGRLQRRRGHARHAMPPSSTTSAPVPAATSVRFDSVIHSTLDHRARRPPSLSRQSTTPTSTPLPPQATRPRPIPRPRPAHRARHRPHHRHRRQRRHRRRARGQR